MKILTINIIFLLICNINYAYSFYSRGVINSFLEYKDLKVYTTGYNINNDNRALNKKLKNKLKNGILVAVSGVIKNNSNKPHSLFVTIKFCDVFKRVLNYKPFSIILRPFDSIAFKEILLELDIYGSKNTQNAHHVEWEIEELPEPLNKKKIPQKNNEKNKSNEKSIIVDSGMVRTASSQSVIYISGKGDQISDKFMLPSGRNIVRVKHDGKEDFKVQLLNEEKKIIGLLSNGSDNFDDSLKIIVKKDMFTFVEVKSKNYWSIEIHKYKKNNIVENTEKLTKTIFLKNGRKILIYDYQEVGTEIQFNKYGGIISIEKSLIDKIVEN